VIVHFNWIKGVGTKAALFERAGMWLLDSAGDCPYSNQ
jgi:hypothetical protein